MKLHALAVATALMMAVPALAETSTSGSAMLVLDASGSMWGQIDGRTKIELARDAVGVLLSGWDAGTSLGLMAYGHRRKGDCADIEVLRDPQGFDPTPLRERVAALSPKGMTPISAAVRHAAEQLRFVERKATVILVSDGEETCNADPCALGRELEAMGVDFTAHVVGFDVADGSVAHRQLQCLAQSTGGRYVQAGNADELNEALRTVSMVEPPPPSAPVPSVTAEAGRAWLPGHALEPDVEVTLDDGSARVERGNVDFTVEQTAQDCQALCDAEAACAGWHYEPTGSFFIDHPRCFLRDRSFAVRLRQEGEGWVAGIKPGAELVLVEQSLEE